jgi:CcmD family protein
MSNWFYVGLAYGVTYLGLMGYTISLIRKHNRAAAALRSEPQRRGD